jgi:hypothetical protein
MYNIDRAHLSEHFLAAWRAAGEYLQTAGGDQIKWLRSNLHQPISEHLSFLFRNQLYFVFIEVIGSEEEVPRLEGNWRERFLDNAAAARAIPCTMPMRQSGLTDFSGYLPGLPRWGLQNSVSGETVDPHGMATAEEIEMSDWEVQDFAVQVVRDSLKKEGKEVTEWQSNPEIDPGVWFVDVDHLAWVVVRASRYPEPLPERPGNIADLAKHLAEMGRPDGFFAGLTVANANDSFTPDQIQPLSLYRGGPLIVKYEGLEAMS